jgi:hypothetical protein
VAIRVDVALGDAALSKRRLKIGDEPRDVVAGGPDEVTVSHRRNHRVSQIFPRAESELSLPAGASTRSAHGGERPSVLAGTLVSHANIPPEISTLPMTSL